eukprot:TRINITY_DN11867_c1_g1_i2.p1 TRINITY_DN11867_c1_g1~~TRINITY_DN11867_c1_g1_i2.p1  ORF type:complete len:125 (-),score=14.61 TRINITY_DN11867_c1_g1_i2:43-417(-)
MPWIGSGRYRNGIRAEGGSPLRGGDCKIPHRQETAQSLGLNVRSPPDLVSRVLGQPAGQPPETKPCGLRPKADNIMPWIGSGRYRNGIRAEGGSPLSGGDCKIPHRQETAQSLGLNVRSPPDLV